MEWIVEIEEIGKRVAFSLFVIIEGKRDDGKKAKVLQWSHCDTHDKTANKHTY